MKKQWKTADIQGVIVKELKKFNDSRGWLAEIVREDEIDKGLMPVMAYISVTHPKISRGPHLHKEQTDIFCMTGPGDFSLRMWDNRQSSPTFGCMMSVSAGESKPCIITIPPGVVHGYTNISDKDSMVLNLPNKLYAGKDKKQPVDEVRFENMVDSDFSMEEH